MKKIILYILVVSLSLNNFTVFAWVIGGDVPPYYFNDMIDWSFNVTNSIENWVCWSSNWQNFTEVPTQNLCASWNTWSITWNWPWTWTCDWINWWSSVTCQANLLTYSINWKVLEKDTNNPLSNVKLELINSSWNTLNTVNTNSSWDYSFSGLVLWNYQIKENVLSWYIASSDFDWWDPSLTNLLLNSDLSNINFIQEKITNNTWTWTTNTWTTNTWSTNTWTIIHTWWTSSYTPPCSENDLVCKKDSSWKYIWTLKESSFCKSENIWNDCSVNTIEKEKEIENKTWNTIPTVTSNDPIPKNIELESAPEKKWIEDAENIVNNYENEVKLLEEIQNDENKVWNNEIVKLPNFLLQTWVPVLERTKVIKNKNVETDTNKEDFRLAWTNSPDINHWLEVVPLEDKNKDLYIILPSQGLVMPINTINKNSEDYKKSINWENFDFYKYLETWALEVPWTSTNWYWEVWNKVVIWHSSYYKSSNWRYKTQFQKIIENEIWEEVWIYQKQESWEYKRYRYITQESYNTDKSDTDVLLSWNWKNLTLYTCTPIWWTSWRWIIKAKYIDEEKNYLSKKVNFSQIKIDDKIAIQKFTNNISKEKSIDVFNKTSPLLEKYSSNTKATNYLDYIRLQIAQKITSKN